MLSSRNVVGGDSPIYRVSGRGRLSLQPGSGKQIVASFDPATYVIAGVGTVAPDGYFVLKASGAIYYCTEDGSQNVRMPGAATAIAPVPGGYFALGNPQSATGARLYYFDYATGVTTAETAYFVSLAYAPNPSANSETLYALDSGHRIWSARFTPTQPLATITEYTVPMFASDRLNAIVAGPDGAMWFTMLNQAVGRISTTGAFSFVSGISTGAIYGIALGSDNALWFSENELGRIGRYVPGASVKEFTIPYAGAAPVAITAGPRGALWFTDPANVATGKITTDGAVSEYRQPNGLGYLFYTTNIAPGPGNTLWSGDTGESDGGIVRTTVGSNGAVTATATYVPVSDSEQAFGFVEGPDGAMWFTQAAEHAGIGRVTSNLTYAIYAAPPATEVTTGAQNIVVGPDGAFWYTDSDDNAIVRFTMNGTYNSYPIPTASSTPTGIAVGSDGALWFTEMGSGKIGRLLPH